MTTPVGELKKIVSLVDRVAFDEFVYPKNSTHTYFQPTFTPYHNYTQETRVHPFSGNPSWGQRVTFEVPFPWQGDFLQWITLRVKPLNWYPTSAQQRLGPAIGDWVPITSEDAWIWADSLGTIALEHAEMEVNGVIIEQFSGDWLHVWNRTMHNTSDAVAFDDAIYGTRVSKSVYNFYPSEDGYVYIYLPFSFTKYQNTGFPLVSCSGPGTVRFHLTFRPFHDVVRKLKNPKQCKETPLGSQLIVRDYSFPFRKLVTVQCDRAIPPFEVADMIVGYAHIEGALRNAYIQNPHELMLHPVVESYFSEPLKYTVNTGDGDTIKISLPLTMANGPLRQIIFFLRRTASILQFNDWNNYSAMLENEVDPVWNPERALLQHAQLYVGTALWADEDEMWWRTNGNIVCPGGIRGVGNYIYAYNFANHPSVFDPTGTLNASRVDLKLNLTVLPPPGTSNTEWTVSVFCIGTNWMRFQNGLANMVFMD